MRAHIVAVIALGAVTITGCVTPKQLKRGLAAERAALEAERSERLRADSMYAAELGAVRADVATLRNDLQTLRTEFGAKITAMEEGLKFAFPVNFAFDDATVREADKAALDRFASVVGKYYSGSVITIEGFADPAGSNRYNMDLSKRRADAVAAYLGEKGLSTSNVRTVGYGESRLINTKAQKDDPGAEANRRVVFVVETNGAAAVTSTAALPQ